MFLPSQIEMLKEYFNHIVVKYQISFVEGKLYWTDHNQFESIPPKLPPSFDNNVEGEI